MRLIDADAVLKDLEDPKKTPWYNFYNPFIRQGMRECMDIIEKTVIKSAPTVDAIHVLRCKDCKHYEETDAKIGTCLLTICGAYPEGYCAWAEVKEQ